MKSRRQGRSPRKNEVIQRGKLFAQTIDVAFHGLYILSPNKWHPQLARILSGDFGPNQKQLILNTVDDRVDFRRRGLGSGCPKNGTQFVQRAQQLNPRHVLAYAWAKE